MVDTPTIITDEKDVLLCNADNHITVVMVTLSARTTFISYLLKESPVSAFCNRQLYSRGVYTLQFLCNTTSCGFFFFLVLLTSGA